MSQMQDKILGAINQRITNAGLEAVAKEQYANTGHIYAQVGFATRLTIHYDFQNSSCSIQIFGTEKPSVQPSDYDAQAENLNGGGWIFRVLDYNDGPRIVKMLDAITLWLTPMKQRMKCQKPDCDGSLEANPKLYLSQWEDGTWTIAGVEDQEARITCDDNEHDNSTHEGLQALSAWLESLFPGGTWATS